MAIRIPSLIHLLTGICSLTSLCLAQCCFKAERAATETPGFFDYNITAHSVKHFDNGDLTLRIFFPGSYRIDQNFAPKDYSGTSSCTPLDEEGELIRGRGQPFRNAAECKSLSSDELGVFRRDFRLSVVEVIDIPEPEEVYLNTELCTFNNECEAFEEDRSGEVGFNGTYIPLAVIIVVPIILVVIITAVVFFIWRRARKGDKEFDEGPGKAKHGWRGIFWKPPKTQETFEDPEKKSADSPTGTPVPPEFASNHKDFEEKIFNESRNSSRDDGRDSRASRATLVEPQGRETRFSKASIYDTNDQSRNQSRASKLSMSFPPQAASSHQPNSPIPPKSDGDESVSTGVNQRAPPPSQADTRDLRNQAMGGAINRGRPGSSAINMPTHNIPSFSHGPLIESIDQRKDAVKQTAADARAKSAMGVRNVPNRNSYLPSPSPGPFVQRPVSQQHFTQQPSGHTNPTAGSSMANPAFLPVFNVNHQIPSSGSESLSGSGHGSSARLSSSQNYAAQGAQGNFLNPKKQERITKWTEDIARVRVQPRPNSGMADAEDNLPLGSQRRRIAGGDDDDVPLGARGYGRDDDDVPLGRR